MLLFLLSTHTRKWDQNQLTQVLASWLDSFPFLPDKRIISLACRTKAQFLHVSFRRERKGRGARNPPEKSEEIKWRMFCTAIISPAKSSGNAEKEKILGLPKRKLADSLFCWIAAKPDPLKTE